MGERSCWVVEGVVERLGDGTLETERVEIESPEVESPEVERPRVERLNVESDESRVFSVAEAVSVEPPEIGLVDSDVVEGLDAGSAKLVPESFPHVFTVTNTVTGSCETTKAPVPNNKQIIEAETMISFLRTRTEGEFDSRQRKTAWFDSGSI